MIDILLTSAILLHFIVPFYLLYRDDKVGMENLLKEIKEKEKG